MRTLVTLAVAVQVLVGACSSTDAKNAVAVTSGNSTRASSGMPASAGATSVR